MKLLVFAVRDVKAEAFLPPFFMKTNGMATRAFMDEVNREKSSFGEHPEDFSLFRIAEFDEESAAFVNEIQPVPLMSAMTAVVSEPPALKVAG